MKIEPLDFTEDTRPATLLMAVAVIVKHYGSEGCTLEDICGTVQRNLPQWKPSSVSPCVSKLRAVGAVREETKFGVRRVFHVRDYEPDTDNVAIKQHEARVAGQKSGLSPSEAPVAGQLKMLIAIGENKTEAMTIAEARALWQQLDAIFGNKK